MKESVLKIIKLNSLLNNLVEGFDDFLYVKKINLTIKDKILIFLYERNHAPYELIKLLSVAKSNLTLCANDLIKEGLIVKEKDSIDKRNIVYSITSKGKELAKTKIVLLEKVIFDKIEYKNNNEEFLKNIDNLIKFLN